jgi:hypothetical protein
MEAFPVLLFASRLDVIAVFVVARSWCRHYSSLGFTLPTYKIIDHLRSCIRVSPVMKVGTSSTSLVTCSQPIVASEKLGRFTLVPLSFHSETIDNMKVRWEFMEYMFRPSPSVRLWNSSLEGGLSNVTI